MLNFTSKIQTAIIYSLAGFIVTLVSALVWTKIQLSTAKSDVTKQEAITVVLRSDLQRALDAEESCSRVVKKLVQNAQKKHRVIKEYKNKIEKGTEHEKINNIDDFINYANGLR